MKKPEKETVLVRVAVPVEVHRRLKGAAGLDGKTVPNKVVDLLDKALPPMPKGKS